ncbi:transglutaminase domain-containing protein [Dokdonia sp.]|uniref:transglutaminase domain-containing protein n=1 Tax=Dokdonia sp. TaxID=2024995 RepID=UPI003263610A
MMVKYRLLMFLVLFMSTVVTAQEYKVGKIKKQHFEIALNDEQKAAPAVYLNKYRRTHFEYRDELDGWVLFTTVHDVIKINSISGFSYGTKKMQLYHDGREVENIKKIEAYTYNLEDGKVKRIKMGKESIIKNRLTDNVDEVSIAIPAIRQGSIIEYQYVIESTYWAIDDVIFQEDIPVKNAFAKIEVPQFFDYNKFVKGYLDIDPKLYVESRNENFSIEQKNPFGGRTSRTLTSNIQYKEAVSEYSLKDIPALKKEAFVNNMDNYRVSIVYELAAVEFREGKKQTRAKSWEEVAQFLNSDDRIAGQIKRTNFLNDVSTELKSKSVATLDRVHMAYKYIQNKMTWDRSANKYRVQNLRKAYNDNAGTAYEINVLLVALLKKMGLKAAPVMASTKGHGIPIYPTINGFDYVVAAVYYNNEWILMDATGKNLYPGLLPERVMNWEGRLIKENGQSIAIPLFSKEYSSNRSLMIATIDEKGAISGKCRRNFSNSEGIYIRNTYKGISKDRQEEILKEQINLDEVSDISFNLDHLFKPATISFSFNTVDFTEIIGDKMYLSPQLFLIKSQNPFKSSDRVLPIDFRYPRTVENTITFTIPEDYKVVSIPANLEVNISEGLGSYKIKFKQINETSIQISSSFRNNSTLVEADAYNEIKDFYTQIVTKEKEKVVLIKK